MSQGAGATLSAKMLDSIYDQVLENLKRSGMFDQMRISLMNPAIKNPKFKAIFDTFMESYSKNLKLDLDRKALRSNLERDIHNDYRVKLSLNDLIKDVLGDKGPEIEKHFSAHAEEFLRKEFQRQSPEPETKEATTTTKTTTSATNSTREIKQEVPSAPDDENQVDMDLESSYGEVEIDAPAYSPVSEDANGIDQNDTEDHLPVPPITVKNEPNMTNHIEQKPSLENIPIPPEDIPIPSDDEPPTPVMDERPQEELDPAEDDEMMTFSSISSVHTNDLSDFEDSINLSDDEAKIVGQPIKSRMKIEELQKNINGLNTNRFDMETREPNSDASMLCETSESDACSDSAATGRRAARQRKSNPRYSSEHFTS